MNLPRGKIVELLGPKGSGKTTQALQAIAAHEGVCAYVDADHTLDLLYAKSLGVNCSRMLLSQPDSGEQTLDVLEALVRSEQVSLVVLDSLTSLTLAATVDPHLQARLMSRAMRTLANLAQQTGTTVLFLGEDGNGNNALKFYASLRMRLDPTGLVVIKDKS